MSGARKTGFLPVSPLPPPMVFFLLLTDDDDDDDDNEDADSVGVSPINTLEAWHFNQIYMYVV